MRVLFYAINHVGLGHVVRLSVVQKYLQNQGIDCCFFSESQHAAKFFNCPGLLEPTSTPSGRRAVSGFRRALARFTPDVLVCDTMWPSEAIGMLRRKGVRTVVIQRMLSRPFMTAAIRQATTVFDSILLPHHPSEVLWTYRDHPALLDRLSSLSLGLLGPIARSAEKPSRKRRIIFTLGAGGDSRFMPKRNRIDHILRVFIETSDRMQRLGYARPQLAAGPLLKVDAEIRERFDVLQTTSLFEHFGPNTIVISRGGYNTNWEVVAAGGRLIVCGYRTAMDDVTARSEFIEREALGRKTPLTARHLIKAIETETTATEKRAARTWQPLVNAGLSMAAAEITGSSFLRSKEQT